MYARERMPRWLAMVFLVAICSVGAIAQETIEQPSGPSLSARALSGTNGWAEIVVHTRPAVVVIETDKGLGSGFVIKSDGIIVTNDHVVADATAMAVKFSSGEVYRSVYLLSSDPIKDLAFLKIEAVDLPTISLGNSNEVQVGEEALLVGAPKGLDQTVSSGLISGIRFEGGVRVLQTTAAASPGSSGGPLLNKKGEAVGVMSYKVVNGENLNFTIPINYVRGKLDSLPLSSSKTFGSLKTQYEKHQGVWVAGHGSAGFADIYMEILDILGSSGVVVANDGVLKFTDPNTTGFMPLPSLIGMLPKVGASSLLYVKVEPGMTSMAATVYLQCFDGSGHALWSEKANDVLVSGGNTLFHPRGWKSKLAPHIGKSGLELKPGQGQDSAKTKQ